MGIVNAVDICKYPQHFNRLLLIAMNKYCLLYTSDAADD